MEQLLKAVLVGVNVNNQKNFEESMVELENLVIACDMEVVGRADQNLKAINKATYIGSGKVGEIRNITDELQADVLVFNNELSPSQLRNLERELEHKILDRTSLILDIFAQRAQTREAKLQVELASLKYMLPRLVGLNEALDRQYGGVGTISRGGGEKKLVLDRRRIEEKITELSKELEQVSLERRTQRKQRSKSGLPSVALVGYTNAGKSTLMNAIMDLSQRPESKKVFEKDMLFATLETSVRKITLPDNKVFLLSDTVGFVSNLPHELVKAFRSTLEEVRSADLLLHVVDASDPNSSHQVEVTNETLRQIGAGDIPMIHVYNKADLTAMNIPYTKADDIYISAREKIGVEELTQEISKKIFKEYVECKMLIPYDQGGIAAYLNENANVKEISYESGGTLITLECKESEYRMYGEYIYYDQP